MISIPAIILLESQLDDLLRLVINQIEISGGAESSAHTISQCAHYFLSAIVLINESLISLARPADCGF